MGAIKKVDIDNGRYTYSSYVKAGNFIFTSICSGFGETITEATKRALDTMRVYLNHAGVDLDDLVKVTVTFKRGECFNELKEVFKQYFKNGYPARSGLLVDEFLGDMLLQIEGIAYREDNTVGGHIDE
ncbi:MAG: RidA family protein [Clostridiales bacterium]|nr:RidA family protein [Clostridiales bacterium]